MFSIRVKELFEPIVLRGGGGTDGFLLFALFKNTLFRNHVTLGAFTVKTQDMYLTENRLGTNLETKDNYSYMCHICVKGF